MRQCLITDCCVASACSPSQLLALSQAPSPGRWRDFSVGDACETGPEPKIEESQDTRAKIHESQERADETPPLGSGGETNDCSVRIGQGSFPVRLRRSHPDTYTQTYSIPYLTRPPAEVHTPLSLYLCLLLPYTRLPPYPTEPSSTEL